MQKPITPPKTFDNIEFWGGGVSGENTKYNVKQFLTYTEADRHAFDMGRINRIVNEAGIEGLMVHNLRSGFTVVHEYDEETGQMTAANAVILDMDVSVSETISDESNGRARFASMAGCQIAERAAGYMQGRIDEVKAENFTKALSSLAEDNTLEK